MTQRNALVMAGGLVEQLQAGDSFLTGQSPGKRNAIINGNFDIWQRGTSFAPGTSSAITADRWQYFTNVTGVATVAQSTDVPTVAQSNAFSSFSVKLACTTAQASIPAGGTLILGYRIEGLPFRALAQRSMVFSFWVKCHQTGIFCIALGNSGSDRVYVAEYTIAVADTWQKVVINIPASPSAGTWNYAGGIGLQVNFSLAIGSTFNTGTNNTWNTSNVFATSNQSNFLSSTSNTFLVSQVQLEQGDSPSLFENVLWEEELARCQRYYYKSFEYGTAPAQASGDFASTLEYRVSLAGSVNQSVRIEFPVTMRTTPSITYYSPSSANATWRNSDRSLDSGAAATDFAGSHSLSVRNPQTASDLAGNVIAVHFAANAEL